MSSDLGMRILLLNTSSSSLIPRLTCKSLGTRLLQLPSLRECRSDCFLLSKVRLLPFLPGLRPEHKH